MLKFSGLVIWRLGSRNYVRKYSASGVTILEKTSDSSEKLTNKKIEEHSLPAKEGLVAAAFASLNDPDNDNRKPSPKSFKPSRVQQIDSQILKADDLNSLLLVAENPIVSRRHALKMVSILSEWSSSNKVNLTDFEKDPRFLKLCRILARTPTTQAMSSLTMAEDLSTVLGITGDDEAARLIANLSLPQMIKVMKALQQKGRRSTPLLRALSYNITKQSEPLDLKKSADLLYSMAALNFPDPLLLDRICSDIIECLPRDGGRAAVVSSMLVSLGVLRVRHEAALGALAGWLAGGGPQGRGGPQGGGGPQRRPGDLAAAANTFAALHYVPPEAHDLLEAALLLKEEEMVKASSWLDLVYSLLILDKAEQHHLVSTLKPEFIERLLSFGEIPIPARLKLMSIDAYVGLKFPSNKIRLAEDISVGVPVMHSKEKTLYVQSIMDTFKSLVSAETFLKRGCDSGMGFLYDGELVLDALCHPVPLQHARTHDRVCRVALLALDYGDMTRGIVRPLGARRLHCRLLALKGFKVLEIPYTEYNPKDKLVTRVQYIEKRLKEIVNESNS